MHTWHGLACLGQGLRWPSLTRHLPVTQREWLAGSGWLVWLLGRDVLGLFGAILRHSQGLTLAAPLPRSVCLEMIP